MRNLPRQFAIIPASTTKPQMISRIQIKKKLCWKDVAEAVGVSTGK